MAVPLSLLTAEAFARTTDNGRRTELVRGRIVEYVPNSFIHGLACTGIAFAIGFHVMERDLGEVLIGNVGIITARNPDSVRGPDVVYYTAARYPAHDERDGWPEHPPDLVIEVLSFADRWVDHLDKAAEFLIAGTPAVVILDPDTRSAHVFRSDGPPHALGPEDTLTFPDLLGDFAVVVGRIFD